MAIGLVSAAMYFPIQVQPFCVETPTVCFIGYVYEMLKTLEHPVIPCFTCSRCCANFGQDSFLYKPANEAKARFIGLVCDWAEALQSSVTETD